MAAVLRIWSSASSEKFTVITSTMGRMPAAAAPIPAPVKPDSESGVSRMRVLAKLLHQPLGDRVAAAIGAHILAHQEHPVIAQERIADTLFHRLPIGHLLGLSGGSCLPLHPS